MRAEEHQAARSPAPDVHPRPVTGEAVRNLEAGEILKFGTAVVDLLGSGKAADPILQEVAKIHELMVKNLARVRYGRPICKLT